MSDAAGQSAVHGSVPLENERHEYFAQQCVLQTRAEAARRAGYSTKTARKIAWELYQDAAIRARVEFLREDALEDAGVDAHAFLRELAIVARSSLAHYELDNDGTVRLTKNAPRDALRAIQSIEPATTDAKWGVITKPARIRLHDKVRAVEIGLKKLGLLKDQHEHTGKDGAPIEHNHSITVSFVKAKAHNEEPK
jgi:phage terminase small subunit